MKLFWLPDCRQAYLRRSCLRSRLITPRADSGAWVGETRVRQGRRAGRAREGAARVVWRRNRLPPMAGGRKPPDSPDCDPQGRSPWTAIHDGSRKPGDHGRPSGRPFFSTHPAGHSPCGSGLSPTKLVREALNCRTEVRPTQVLAGLPDRFQQPIDSDSVPAGKPFQFVERLQRFPRRQCIGIE